MFEYLICMGTMKAGTTTLYDLLRKHPGIRPGHKKELHYFDKTSFPSKAEYDALFRPGDGVKMDITPIYMYDTPSLDRLTGIIDPSSCAVVVLLRDPVERALSHYRMNLSKSQEKEPFEKCFDLEPDRIVKSANCQKLYSYFSRGLYAAQLDELYWRFPSENIKVFLFEDFIKDQQACIDELCAFAKLPPIKVTPQHSNMSVTHYKSKALGNAMRSLARLVPNHLKTNWMRKIKYFILNANQDQKVRDEISPAFLERLIAYYRDDVDRLRGEYGIDTGKWKHFSN